MIKISEKIEIIIKSGFSNFMKNEGFKKSGKNWHKQFEGYCWIVNIQSSQSNFGDTGKFTINLGVYHHTIEQLANGQPLITKPKEYEATIRTRLGSLFTEHDYWWQIKDQTFLEDITHDLILKMKNYGFPWLINHIKVEQIYEAIGSGLSDKALATVLLVKGTNETKQRIKAAMIERPLGNDYFNQWAEKHKIDLS